LYPQSPEAGLKIKLELQVSVQVYNSAHISISDLTKAKAEAASMFQKAKIKIAWIEGLMSGDLKSHSMSNEAWSTAPLQLRICTRGMVSPKVVESEKLGFVVSMEQGHAVVLCDAVQYLAASRFTDAANLLGLAMAHEMGHLLLQSSAHSAAGIMRAQWFPKDLRDAEDGFLMFTREQDRLMQNEVRHRMGMDHER
jgi:hypothetical protein